MVDLMRPTFGDAMSSASWRREGESKRSELPDGSECMTFGAFTGNWRLKFSC